MEDCVGPVDHGSRRHRSGPGVRGGLEWTGTGSPDGVGGEAETWFTSGTYTTQGSDPGVRREGRMCVNTPGGVGGETGAG